MICSLVNLAVFAAAGLLATAVSGGAELATATISGTPAGAGNFEYNLTLTDTGTTNLGTFWFAWIPGDNFMPLSPTDIMSPTGWQEKVTHGGPSNGYAIQWTSQTPGNDLSAGSSLPGFSFESSLTLAQLESPSTGNPADLVATAFVYGGSPFSDAGDQLTVTAATPEPSNFAIAALGCGLLLVRLRRRILPSVLLSKRTRQA